ncbi:MAG: hypothetical protein E7598_04690 [Ruminococcaceae bacterium]|nr:hypothetical protein [Oscillospiraceae bacterium]
MKKITAIILVCLLVSCTAQKETVPDEFCADVAINIGGKEYLAIYEKRYQSDRLVFSSPDNLKGLDLTLQSGIVTVKIKDTVFESETLSRMFDFLPVLENGTKILGNREYTIYNIRGVT